MAPTPTHPASIAPDLAYLRAATAGLRHHTRQTAARTEPDPVTRAELDALHAHLATLHALASRIAARARDAGTPAHTSQLIAARTRLWQAAACLHAAFHTTPHPGAATPEPRGEPCPAAGTGTGTGEEETASQELPPGPPWLTICQRHLVTATAVRRQTTPADLHDPLHGHTHHPTPDHQEQA